MLRIITTSELQRSVGKLQEWVTRMTVIVTSRGKPRAVVLPYFEENQAAIDEYLEDYEMYRNREALEEEFRRSVESGPSDLVI